MPPFIPAAPSYRDKAHRTKHTTQTHTIFIHSLYRQKSTKTPKVTKTRAKNTANVTRPPRHSPTFDPNVIHLHPFPPRLPIRHFAPPLAPPHSLSYWLVSSFKVYY